MQVDDYLDLLNIITKLANKSNKPYVIFRFSEEEGTPIVDFNLNYVQLTKYSKSQLFHLSRKSFLSILMDKKSQEQFSKSMREGKLLTLRALHKRNKEVPFSAEIECFPFDEIGETKFVLLFITDISGEILSEAVEKIEQNIYQSIEKNEQILTKFHQVCSKIDEIFHPNTFTTFVLLEQGHLYLTASNKMPTVEELFEIKDENLKKNYMDLMYLQGIQEISSQMGANLYEPHVYYAHQNHYKKTLVIPLNSSEFGPYGAMIIYYDELRGFESEMKHFFERIQNLLSLVYVYKRRQQKIEQLAYLDPVLNIPNRHRFLELVEQYRNEQTTGIIKILQINEFPQVVELYGREAGEKLLLQLTYRLQLIFSNEFFIIGRFSSASIIIFTNDYLEVYSSPRPKHLDVINEPLQVEGHLLYATLKCGVGPVMSYIPTNDAVRYAEISLSEAKKTAGNQTVFYNERINRCLEREMSIARHLNEALHNNELSVHLQPKINLSNKMVCGYEALVRWDSVKLGFVPPIEFIPIAEKIGLIKDVELFVFKEVAMFQRQKRVGDNTVVPIAVNISPDHFYQPQFYYSIMSILKEVGVSPLDFTIELTESISLFNIERAKGIIGQLKATGFKVSVDDFGIGYSSLSYIQKLSFDELKIDRSFTMNMEDQGTLSIMKSVIQMAQDLNMNIVVEGVETREQAEQLQRLGCHVAQGYFYSKPKEMKQFAH